MTLGGSRGNLGQQSISTRCDRTVQVLAGTQRESPGNGGGVDQVNRATGR